MTHGQLTNAARRGLQGKGEGVVVQWEKETQKERGR